MLLEVGSCDYLPDLIIDLLPSMGRFSMEHDCQHFWVFPRVESVISVAKSNRAVIGHTLQGGPCGIQDIVQGSLNGLEDFVVRIASVVISLKTPPFEVWWYVGVRVSFSEWRARLR